MEARTKLSLAIVHYNGSHLAQSSHGKGQTFSNMALGIIASTYLEATSISEFGKQFGTYFYSALPVWTVGPLTKRGGRLLGLKPISIKVT